MAETKKSIRQLTEETGFDRQTVTNRLKRAKLNPVKSGRSHLYDTREALPAIYCLVEDGNLDLTAERARLAHWQGVRAELDARQRQGELVPVKEVEATWCEMVGNARAKLLTLPSQLAPIALGATSHREVEEAARRIVYDALQSLAGNG